MIIYRKKFSLSGLFGTGVLSYFTFLRWLLYLNILVMVFILSFVFIPQVISDKSSNPTNETFSGLELITGEVRISHPEFFELIFCIWGKT